MLAEGLVAVAATAGSGLVQAMTTDAWQQCRDRAARLLGRGDAGEESRQQTRLDRTRAELTQAAAAGDEEGRQIVVRQSAAWQTRFEDLLETSPEQEAPMRELLGFLREQLPSAPPPGRSPCTRPRPSRRSRPSRGRAPSTTPSARGSRGDAGRPRNRRTRRARRERW
ncbi:MULTISPECIES: hypothetical protein [unclassified Streptomyces]|uniref:hypothetical protein n=1 Tax=unclassified Streptomyces TaxID=2593676 RepID=UPI000B12108F|nr:MULTISPECIES: hypothetical protein [unclassified Streptomyces]